MFLVSMADIIGSYERLPNDAVGAVAVAKRREYLHDLHHLLIDNFTIRHPQPVASSESFDSVMQKKLNQRTDHIRSSVSQCFPYFDDKRSQFVMLGRVGLWNC